jgi:hypothetical protein
MGVLETDYLVVGAGATGLAFTDVLVAESDAEVLLVDRRPGPGGHWNDAYPFVRLHQPSITYGVPSLPLGEARVVDGQQERATGADVLAHFGRALEDVLLPSGRVRFLGGTDASLDGPPRLTDLATGTTTDVVVRRKVVDATRLSGDVPATSGPSYDVDAGSRWVRVGGLPEAASGAATYCVVGAGKTGMDACLWLLQRGVEPDAITWVRPRDMWLLDRASVQPLAEVGAVLEGASLDLEALSLATSLEDLFARLEATGRLLRLDEDVQPTGFRCAIVDAHEVARLRSLRRVVRKGHVLRVEPHRLVLEQGEVALEPGTLVVDCSARGLSTFPAEPVFTADLVVVQLVRMCSPTFSAALCAWVEAHRDDVDEQNALCPPNPPPLVPFDWVRMQVVSLEAAKAWRAAPDLLAWLEACRLNITAGALAHADDPRLQQAFLRRQAHLKPALQRAATLMA